MTLDIDTEDGVLTIHKEYPITQFNWTLEFLFKQNKYSDKDISEIKSKIESLLDKEDKSKLTTLFNQNTFNSALSVSNKSNRKSFIILTQVSSIGQFVNSLIHEMLHLSRHIDECGNNEELFTILGNISGNIVSELYSL